MLISLIVIVVKTVVKHAYVNRYIILEYYKFIKNRLICVSQQLGTGSY